MKYVYGLLAIVCFVVGVVLSSSNILLAILFWLASGVLVGVSLNASTKAAEEKLSRELDAQMAESGIEIEPPNGGA